MPEDYVSPLGSLVNWIEGERQRNRQQEDADLDQKIALIHDMITGPGANPARTADGIRGILELQQAKGGRQKGKRKAGIAGFMGANEEMMPDFLAQLIHKDRPYQGPTFSEQTNEVKQPATVGRLPGQMDQQPQFSGQSVLSEPVMVPPPPLDAAPSGGRMLDAARQMQTQPQGQVALPGAMGMQTTKTQLPDAQQPFMRSPEEMAQLEGNAAGIKENAIYDARNQAKIAMWKRAGLSDDEIRQMLLREATGTGAQLSIQDAGYVKVGDQVYHAVRQLNPRTQQWDTVDQLTGMPIPPGAIPVAAPASRTSEDNYTLGDAINDAEAERAAAGRPPLTFAEKMKIQNDWQQNGKPPTINVMNTGMPGSDLNYRQAGIINPIIAGYRNSAPVKAVARMAPLEGVVKRIEQNPSNAFAQLTEIYGFIQALDTYQSTVREGEIGLTQQTMSKVENLKNTLTRITNARLLSPEAALGIAREARALMADIRTSATDAAKMYRAQAAVNGLTSSWDQFMSQAGIGGLTPPPGDGASTISPGAQAVLDYLRQP